jgi:hypothetical protein
MPGVALVVLGEGDEVWTIGWARFEKVVCNDEARDCKELNSDCADASSADASSEDGMLAVVAGAVVVMDGTLAVVAVAVMVMDVQKSKNCAKSGSM